MVIRLFVICVLIISISGRLLRHQEQQQPRIRKSIHAVTPIERKAYFWSSKMLGILPPKGQFLKWEWFSILGSGQQMQEARKMIVEPKCLHDILLASHQTNMAHRSFYFIPFHKHWVMLFQIFLIHAHRILCGGKEILEDIYPGLYKEHQQLWDRIFGIYQKDGMAKLKDIAAHYWNPTNFNEKNDILQVPELASPWSRPGRVPDQMDELYFSVRGHHPWEISIKHRLVSRNYQWDVEDIVKRLRKSGQFRLSNSTLQKYTQNEQAMLDGYLTPRNQPEGQSFSDFNKTFTYYMPDLDNGHHMQVVKGRFQDYFRNDGNQQRLPLFNMTRHEFFTNYGFNAKQGNRFIKRSYITKDQRLQLNIPYNLATQYNRRLPQYTFGLALFNRRMTPNLREYLRTQRGTQISHAKMHFYHSQLFQAMGLHIFLMHSWIDFQTQIRIRLNNNEDRKDPKRPNFESMNKAFDQQTVGQQYHHIIQDFDTLKTQQQKKAYNNAMNKQFHNYYKGKEGIVHDDDFRKMRAGDFLITQNINPWFLPRILNGSWDESDDAFSGALSYRQFLMTKHQIRQSTELNELYRNFAKHNGKLYSSFIDLSTINFNYNYEVRDGPNRTHMLLQDASNMPEYLLTMRQDVREELYDVVDQNINRTIDVFYGKPFQVFTLQNKRIESLYQQDPIKNQLEVKTKLQEYYLGFLRNVSYSFVSYPRSKALGVYTIKLKIDNKLPCFSVLKSKMESVLKLYQSLINELTTSGVLVQKLNIRESSTSKYCSQCHQTKSTLLDLDADLLQSNRTLWKTFRMLYLTQSKVLQPDDEVTCFRRSYIFEVEENLKSQQSPIAARVVQGAEQVKLWIQLQNQQQNHVVSGTLLIELNVSSINFKQNSLRTIVSRDINQISYTLINFPKLQDLQPVKVANHIESYLYSSIKIQWIRDNTGHIETIYYQIPHFSLLANYRLIVDPQLLKLRLEDADFEFKKQFIKSFDFDIVQKVTPCHGCL